MGKRNRCNASLKLNNSENFKFFELKYKMFISSENVSSETLHLNLFVNLNGSNE